MSVRFCTGLRPGFLLRPEKGHLHTASSIPTWTPLWLVGGGPKISDISKQTLNKSSLQLLQKNIQPGDIFWDKQSRGEKKITIF